MQKLSSASKKRKETGNLQQLPQELLINLFGFFSPKDLGSISLSCKNFYNAFQADYLWKEKLKKDFNPFNFSPKQHYQNALGELKNFYLLLKGFSEREASEHSNPNFPEFEIMTSTCEALSRISSLYDMKLFVKALLTKFPQIADFEFKLETFEGDGLDEDKRITESLTMLHLAARAGAIELLEEVLRITTIDIHSDYIGTTPIEFAIGGTSDEVSEFFPLHEYCERLPKIIQILLDHGSDYNLRWDSLEHNICLNFNNEKKEMVSSLFKAIKQQTKTISMQL